jgi:hypothetical protein
MKIRVLTLALPAALGLACSHSQGTRTASSGQTEAGTATAGTESSSGTAGTSGISGSAPGELKGHDSDRIVSGTVADASGSALIIESQTGERQTLKVVDETTIVMTDGTDGNASDLRPGQEVRASFNDQSGEQVAVKVIAIGVAPSGSMGTGSTGTDRGSSGTDTSGTDTSGTGSSSTTTPVPGSGTTPGASPSTPSDTSGTSSGTTKP